MYADTQKCQVILRMSERPSLAYLSNDATQMSAFLGKTE